MENLNFIGKALNPIAPEKVAAFLPVGARVIDIGCGEGILLRYLQENGWTAVGAEPDSSRFLKAKLNCPNTAIVNAFAEKLPLPENSFDAAVMECSFSLCEPEETVKELCRVLVPGGRLIVTDLFSHDGQAVLNNSAMVRNIYPLDALEAFFRNDFTLAGFENRTRELQEMFAQMILDDTACSCVAPEDLRMLRAARPGYGVWIWTKL